MTKVNDGEILHEDNYTDGTQIHESVDTLPDPSERPDGQVVVFGENLRYNAGDKWTPLGLDNEFAFGAYPSSLEVSTLNDLAQDESVMDTVTDRGDGMNRITESEKAMDSITDFEVAMDKVMSKVMARDKFYNANYWVDKGILTRSQEVGETVLTESNWTQNLTFDQITDDNTNMEEMTDSEQSMDDATSSEVAMDKVTDKEMPMDKVYSKQTPLEKFFDVTFPISNFGSANVDVTFEGDRIKFERNSEAHETKFPLVLATTIDFTYRDNFDVFVSADTLGETSSRFEAYIRIGGDTVLVLDGDNDDFVERNIDTSTISGRQSVEFGYNSTSHGGNDNYIIQYGRFLTNV